MMRLSRYQKSISFIPIMKAYPSPAEQYIWLSQTSPASSCYVIFVLRTTSPAKNRCVLWVTVGNCGFFIEACLRFPRTEWNHSDLPREVASRLHYAQRGEGDRLSLFQMIFSQIGRCREGRLTGEWFSLFSDFLETRGEFETYKFSIGIALLRKQSIVLWLT